MWCFLHIKPLGRYFIWASSGHWKRMLTWFVKFISIYLYYPHLSFQFLHQLTFTHYPLVTTWVLTNSFMYNIMYIAFNLTAPILHYKYNGHSITQAPIRTHTHKRTCTHTQAPICTHTHKRAYTHKHTRRQEQVTVAKQHTYTHTVWTQHFEVSDMLPGHQHQPCPALLHGPHQGVPRQGS